MTETLFGYVTAYGLPAIAFSAFLSCLALPIPTFAVMLAGGAFAASGDLVFWQVLLAAFAGAVLGDQVGFHAGRRFGPPLAERLSRDPARRAVIASARAMLRKWGGLGVFLSTWLFAPLGPWVNLLAGTARISRLRFTLWDAAGEAIWVTGYSTLGYLFGARLPVLVDVVGDWAGLVSSAALTVILGALMVRAIRRGGHRPGG